MVDTPKIGLKEISASQSQKEVTHNESLRVLDALVQATALDKDLSSPPGSPSDGDTYVLGSATPASGAWSGHDGEIAYYKSSSWIFLVPEEGWRVSVLDESADYRYDGVDWLAVGTVVSVNSYDVGCSKAGKPSASELLLRLPMVRSVEFADDFAGSEAASGTAAAATSVFTIKKNGASVGTFTFAPAGSTATFATSGGAVSLTAGDVLSVIAPGSQDASLADFGFVLRGIKV